MRANILSIHKDACNFSAVVYALRNPRGTPKTLIRRQRSKPLPLDTQTEEASLSYVTFYGQMMPLSHS